MNAYTANNDEEIPREACLDEILKGEVWKGGME